VTDVGVGSDDWLDDARTIRTTAAFEFQVTTLRPCSRPNLSAILKSTARQTHPSFPVFERRHALFFRAITATLSFRPLLTGELIRDAIRLFCRQKRAAIVTDAAAALSPGTLKPKFTLASRISHSLVQRYR